MYYDNNTDYSNWSFSTQETGETTPSLVWPEERPDDYNPDLYWDEENGTWSETVITAAGGGRYKEQLVAVGQDDDGNGVIYFGAI
jgi:hypothetical protein